MCVVTDSEPRTTTPVEEKRSCYLSKLRDDSHASSEASASPSTSYKPSCFTYTEDSRDSKMDYVAPASPEHASEILNNLCVALPDSPASASSVGGINDPSSSRTGPSPLLGLLDAGLGYSMPTQTMRKATGILLVQPLSTGRNQLASQLEGMGCASQIRHF